MKYASGCSRQVPLSEYKAAASWLQIRTTRCTLKASFIYGNSSCFCVQKVSWLRYG